MKKKTLNSDFKNRMEKSHSSKKSAEKLVPVKRHIDYGLFAIVFMMICYGLVMLFSASMTTGFAAEDDPAHFITKHLIFTGAGILIAWVTAVFLPIRFFDKIWMVIALYLLTTILLLAVNIRSGNPIIRGVEIGGARRWLNILGFQFQPTEIAKFSTVFCYAGYVSWVSKKRAAGAFIKAGEFSQTLFDGFMDIVVPFLAISLWIGVILMQPHISCIVIMVILSFFILISSGIRLRSWVIGIFMILLVLAILFSFFMLIRPLLPEDIQNYVDFDYALTRIKIFSDIDSVGEDVSFQARQSINAIGSGGLFGVGFGSSVQKWGYLPMQYNDYVFSIIAEELGLVGASAVLLLFTLYLILGIKIAKKAVDIHSMMIAFGFSVFIPIHAFLNIGVAANVIPPTGITLPFFSYGGTSTMIFVICVGFLLCVSKSGIVLKRRRM